MPARAVFYRAESFWRFAGARHWDPGFAGTTFEGMGRSEDQAEARPGRTCGALFDDLEMRAARLALAAGVAVLAPLGLDRLVGLARCGRRRQCGHRVLRRHEREAVPRFLGEDPRHGAHRHSELL